MADSPAAPRPLADRAERGSHASLPRASRELAAAAVWLALGGYLYAAGLHAPVRPLLLWGGALPLTWGLTRGVLGLWHLFSVVRRGS